MIIKMEQSFSKAAQKIGKEKDKVVALLAHGDWSAAHSTVADSLTRGRS